MCPTVNRSPHSGAGSIPADPANLEEIMKLEISRTEVAGSNLSPATKVKLLEFLFQQELEENAKKNINDGKKSINDTKSEFEKMVEDLSRPVDYGPIIPYYPNYYPPYDPHKRWTDINTVPVKPLVAWSSVVTKNKK